MRRSVRFVVGIVALAVLAAGCGDDTEDETSPTTTPATSPTTTAAPAADPRTPEQLAADRAAAERAVLKLADFPPGWTAEPDTDDTSPEVQAARERFAACVGLDRSLLGPATSDRPSAESDDFENGRLEAESRVTMMPSANRANEQLVALRKPESRGCFETFVNAALQQLASRGSVQVHVDVLNLAGLHADSLGYRAMLRVTDRGETVEAFIDILLAPKGRAVINTFFVNIGGPFPADLETSLTNTVIDRAAAA